MRFIAAITALAVVLGAAPLHSVETAGLPSELAAYRTWSALLKEPRAVPYDVALECAWLGQKGWDKAAQPHGSHGKRFIQVYANPEAAGALSAQGDKPFPVGAVIAKEKLAGPDSHDPEGIAFMVKRKSPEFEPSGGWEFLYYPEVGKTPVAQASCARCHKASGHDFVLGSY